MADQHQAYRRFDPRLAKVGQLLDLLYPIFRVVAHRKVDPVQEPLAALEPKSILVFESHLIGDTVLLTSLLRALRIKFPAASLEVLGNPWVEDLLKPLGLVDRFEIQRIPWSTYDYSFRNLKALFAKCRELRQRTYDLAIDPRGDARNAVLLWLIGARRRLGLECTGGVRFLTDVASCPGNTFHLLDAKFSVLAPLGIQPPPLPPTLASPAAAESEIQRFLMSVMPNASGKLLGFHPGASQASRNLNIEQKVKVLQGMAALGWFPLLLGSPRDRKGLESVLAMSGLVDSAIFTGTLQQFMALVPHLDLVVAMDSGPAHIVSAFGRPLVVIVEAHKVGITPPRGDNIQAVYPPNGGSIQDLDIDSVLSILRHFVPN